MDRSIDRYKYINLDSTFDRIPDLICFLWSLYCLPRIFCLASANSCQKRKTRSKLSNTSAGFPSPRIWWMLSFLRQLPPWTQVTQVGPGIDVFHRGLAQGQPVIPTLLQEAGQVSHVFHAMRDPMAAFVLLQPDSTSEDTRRIALRIRSRIRHLWF